MKCTTQESRWHYNSKCNLRVWFFHFDSLQFALRLKYAGEFILLFVSDSKKVSVNKKQNQSASSLHVPASCKILVAETLSLGLGREWDIIQTGSAGDEIHRAWLYQLCDKNILFLGYFSTVTNKTIFCSVKVWQKIGKLLNIRVSAAGLPDCLPCYTASTVVPFLDWMLWESPLQNHSLSLSATVFPLCHTEMWVALQRLSLGFVFKFLVLVVPEREGKSRAVNGEDRDNP